MKYGYQNDNLFHSQFRHSFQPIDRAGYGGGHLQGSYRLCLWSFLTAFPIFAEFRFKRWSSGSGGKISGEFYDLADECIVTATLLTRVLRALCLAGGHPQLAYWPALGSYPCPARQSRL
jgi:hypothetical protein